ncbi:MAG: hypothetical protein ACR2PS_18965 [Pseudomonadales bacterium]
MTAQTAFSFPELTAASDVSAGTLNMNMEQTLGSLLDDATFSSITQAFVQMKMVEEELKCFIGRHPEKSMALQNTFCAMRWILGAVVPDPVYRHHVRELLQRVVDGHRLDTGTRAEALMAFHDASLKAPLNTEAMIVAHRLFKEVYGDVPSVIDDELREPWPGAGDELLSGLVRKLTQNRTITP